MSAIRFAEKQYFRQWWILIAIIPAPVIIIVAIIQQMVLGKPFGNNPAPDSVLIITALVVILPSLLFFLVRLETKIDETGIYYRLFPFHLKKRRIGWNEISEAYIRKYNPIGEYGGWGLKGGRKSGKAINVSGNMGMQLILKDGKKLLIGTSQPEQLRYILESAEKKFLKPQFDQ